MVTNEVGENRNRKFNYITTDFYGIYADKSPKICTRVERIFLHKAGLLLDIDVAVPFFK